MYLLKKKLFISTKNFLKYKIILITLLERLVFVNISNIIFMKTEKGYIYGS